VQPREVVFQVAPQALDRVQLWTLWWQPGVPHIVRPLKPLGGMCAAVISEQDVEAVGKCVGERIDEDLEGVGIQVRELQEETRPRRGLHGAIDVEPFEDVLDCADGLHPTSGKAPAADRQQAEAALILTEHAHRPGVVRRNDAFQPLLTRRLKCLEGVRVFGCDWAVAL
jgi:hypothetical protein